MIRLGSSSTTRANILKSFNIEFIQTPSSFDEDKIKTDIPKEFVKEATLGKYKDLFEKYDITIPLLVADSVVCCNDKILRKPKNIKEAKKMLLMQSNNEVSIITCMIFHSKDTYLIDTSTTTYKFDKFLESDLQNYLDSKKWEGKAGGIMVEGFAKKYIKKQIGFESTAMGLTIEKILPLIILKK